MQAGRGKPAPRFKEADLWPICVENKFHPSDPSFTAKINAFAKEKGGAEMLQFCIHNQDSLLSIGEKIWAVEDAEKIIRENAKTRLQKALFCDLCCKSSGEKKVFQTPSASSFPLWASKTPRSYFGMTIVFPLRS